MCVCVYRRMFVCKSANACVSCVRGRLFNITFVRIWRVCAGVHVTYMDNNVCMYVPRCIFVLE